MTIAPECYNKRFKAIQEVIQLIDFTDVPSESCCSNGEPETCNDLGTQLMCKFWNILQENPQVNLERMVRDQIPLELPGDSGPNCSCSDSSQISEARSDMKRMIKDLCEETRCIMQNQQQQIQMRVGAGGKPSGGKSSGSKPAGGAAGSKKDAKKPPGSEGGSCTATCSRPAQNKEPLSEALSDIKKAQTHDTECAWKLNDLMETEDRLSQHIKMLEQKELEGIAQLQQADCMWACMEEAYLAKLKQVHEKQNELLEEEKELEKSVNKWRRQERDAAAALEHLQNACEQVRAEAEVKRCAAKCVKVENEGMKKRSEKLKNELEDLKSETQHRKKLAEKARSTIENDIQEVEKKIKEEIKQRIKGEEAGSIKLKEARDNLIKANKVMLQQHFEYEDHKAEEENLNAEIEVLTQAMNGCQDKCRGKFQQLCDELTSLEEQIKGFKLKCTRCSESCSTSDIRKLCTDCPRCIKARECLIVDTTQCENDPKEECACHVLKSLFIQNILENMRHILDADVKNNGSELGDEVLECLKISTNGKLDMATRRKLHSYIKTTVEKNLDASVMGGAVKTRCEMEPEMYSQLQSCLKEIKVEPLPKAAKTKPEPVKGPCKRWSNEAICSCPKGPDACVCLKKTPQKSNVGSKKSKTYTGSCGMPPTGACMCAPEADKKQGKCATTSTTAADSTATATSNPNLCMCKTQKGNVKNELVSEVAGSYGAVQPQRRISTTPGSNIHVPPQSLPLALPSVEGIPAAIIIPARDSSPSAAPSSRGSPPARKKLSAPDVSKPEPSAISLKAATSRLLYDIIDKISKSVQSLFHRSQTNTVPAESIATSTRNLSKIESMDSSKSSPNKITRAGLPEQTKPYTKLSFSETTKPELSISRRGSSELSKAAVTPRQSNEIKTSKTNSDVNMDGPEIPSCCSLASCRSQGAKTLVRFDGGTDISIQKANTMRPCAKAYSSLKEQKISDDIQSSAGPTEDFPIIADVSMKTANTESVKRNPDGSIVYCDPKTCTGPCSKRNRNPQVNTGTNQQFQGRRCSRTVERKCNRDIYFSLTRSGTSKNKHFPKLEVEAVEEQTHLVEYLSKEPSEFYNTESIYEWARKSLAENERQRLRTEMFTNVEPQLPNFLRDYSLSGNSVPVKKRKNYRKCRF